MSESLLEVNLIDTSFAHIPLPLGVCSKQPSFFRWIRNQVDYSGITIYTDDALNHNAVEQYRGQYRVALLLEPFSISPHIYREITHLEAVFDEIWTFDKDLLGKNPTKYKRFVYGSSWVTPSPNPQKNRHISMVFSKKRKTKFQTVRHTLYECLKRKFGDQILFAGSGIAGKEMSREKRQEVLSESRFTLAIENAPIDNYFTEKLVDPVLLKTVPIYMGCPNIGGFFNLKGIMHAHDPVHAVDLITQILESPLKMYDARLPYMEENYRLGLENYEIPEDWIYRHLICPLLKSGKTFIKG